jgi:hypothetical protein
MGREKGVHAVLSTQGLADLRKVDPVFENQILIRSSKSYSKERRFISLKWGNLNGTR